MVGNARARAAGNKWEGTRNGTATRNKMHARRKGSAPRRTQNCTGIMLRHTVRRYNTVVVIQRRSAYGTRAAKCNGMAVTR